MKECASNFRFSDNFVKKYSCKLPSFIWDVQNHWVDSIENYVDRDTIILDGIVELLDLKIEYTLQKLKLSRVADLFGYYPSTSEASCVQCTPELTYCAFKGSISYEDVKETYTC